ncbi:MAG TPA: hypothetical protein VMT70_14825 [Vicinamibacteria bacterium]|nr:hypothetical protein [Vicinamibacteria bacterium]
MDLRAIALLGVVLASASARAEGPPALEPLAFLIGEWSPVGSGQPDQGSGASVFSRALQGRVILRTSYAEYRAGGGAASRHDDLLVIYAGAGGVRADYYDSEGHVIRYGVDVPTAGQVVFLSESVTGEPRYRLTYRLEGGGKLDGEFAIAPPGVPEAFKTYLSWVSSKARVSGPK